MRLILDGRGKGVCEMRMQSLPPEQRKGESKYKHGQMVMYDDRPTEEQQQHLLENAKKYESALKHCLFCSRWMLAADRRLYCSQRCINDAYMERRRKRHEAQLEKVCSVCGAKFKARRKDAVYCSNACKQASYRKEHVTANRSAEFS